MISLQVTISSTLYACVFLYKRCFGSFFYVHTTKESCQNDICLKMLMKLTARINFTNICACFFGSNKMRDFFWQTVHKFGKFLIDFSQNLESQLLVKLNGDYFTKRFAIATTTFSLAEISLVKLTH
jgi:hypothetical protein